MNDIMKEINTAYGLLASIPVRGDAVDAAAACRMACARRTNWQKRGAPGSRRTRAATRAAPTQRHRATEAGGPMWASAPTGAAKPDMEQKRSGAEFAKMGGSEQLPVAESAERDKKRVRWGEEEQGSGATPARRAGGAERSLRRRGGNGMTGNQLPGLAHVDGLNQFRLSQFFGFDHRLGAQNGYIWDMHNLTGDYAPVLASRPPRWTVRPVAKPNGLYCSGKRFLVDGRPSPWTGRRWGRWPTAKSRCRGMSGRVVIWPDKLVYTQEGGAGAPGGQLQCLRPGVWRRRLCRAGGRGQLHHHHRRGVPLPGGRRGVHHRLHQADREQQDPCHPGDQRGRQDAAVL